MNTIDAKTAKARLTSGDEIAFLDVREHGQYGEGHPFFAVPLPYSRLELEAPDLLPRRDAPLLLLDDGDGVAARAADRLRSMGYTNISAVEGGAPGWTAAGLHLFKGVNVPSKTFGELVEHEMHVPSISAKEYASWRAENRPMVVFDGRAPAEYAKMTIPGAKSCPNAELPHRIATLVPDDETPIVVNCAGRTRSIIGAQNLRNLGLPNPIVALENGIQGWRLEGWEPDTDNALDPLEALEGAAFETARGHAAALMAKHAIPSVDLATFENWRDDITRSLYVLDVRSDEEFAAGHLAGSRHAPGGQLVQATDQWIGVRNARIVLVDDAGLRAATTALWLRGMGHDARVLDGDVRALARDGRSGEWRGDTPLPSSHSIATIAAAGIAERLNSGACLMDLSSGMEFRQGHIVGARWTIRPRIAVSLPPGTREVVLCGRDPAAAALAATDLADAGIGALSLCLDGPEAWREAGLDVVASPDDPGDADCIDYLFFVHDRHAGNLDAARAYLAWEMDLLNQLDDQERSVLKAPAG